MIAKYYGKNISITKLRQLTQIGKEGVNLLGIAEAAEKIGFRTKALKLTQKQLSDEARLPAILHWEQNHFVVLYKVTSPSFLKRTSRETYMVADPAKGMIKYNDQEFKKFWVATNGQREVGVSLLLEPTPNFYNADNGTEGQGQKLGWGFLYQYLLQHRKFFFQVILSLCIASALQLIFPFLTQSIVDVGINTQNLQFIVVILIAQVFLVFGRTFSDFVRSRLLLFIGSRINLNILSDFWIKLMKLPVSYFDTKKTGDILQRIGDHGRIQSFLTGSTLGVLFSMLNLIIFSIVLLSYKSDIFFVFCAGSILYFLWIRFFLKYRRKLDTQRFAIASRENSATMQLIHGMQEIRLNNCEKSMRWEWESLQTALFKLSFKGLSVSQVQQAGAIFINETKNLIITFFVAKAVIDGQLTLGVMVAIQYIIGQLNSPVEQLIGFMQQSQDAKLSLERLNEIHEVEDEEKESVAYQKHLPRDKSITIRNLSFTYTGAGNDPVLKDIDLHIPEGKVTAIVGMSGSGKTTLLKLLLRFYEHYEGEIRIGENNLKNISHSFWRGQCGSVMQDGYIFNATIAKNIGITDEVPQYEKLDHAAEIAHISDFVESLPLSYHTKIGNEGTGISAGQKQRILIARAVYKSPSYLFFDEATNSLDANNEKMILESLDRFFEGRTVLVVAHRLSTVRNADNIVVLHKGRIVEQGTHAELIDNHSHYYELVKNQLELGG